MTKTPPGGRPPVSKLNTKNLEKNPSTGIFALKISNTNNTNNSLSFFSQKIPNGIPLAAKTNSVTSEDIKPPAEIPQQSQVGSVLVEPKKEGVKVDWTKLVIYYLFVLHIIVIGYFIHKKKLFEKIKNPFIKTP